MYASHKYDRIPRTAFQQHRVRYCLVSRGYKQRIYKVQASRGFR